MGGRSESDSGERGPVVGGRRVGLTAPEGDLREGGLDEATVKVSTGAGSWVL